MKPGWDFLYWFAGAVCRRLIRWIENCLNTAVIVADALREGDIELLRVALGQGAAHPTRYKRPLFLLRNLKSGGRLNDKNGDPVIPVAVIFSDVNYKTYHAQTMGRRLPVYHFKQSGRKLLYSM